MESVHVSLVARFRNARRAIAIYLTYPPTSPTSPTHPPHLPTHLTYPPQCCQILLQGFQITALEAINATLQTVVESGQGTMTVIALVIGLNLAIALFGFWVAWRLWQLKRTLTAATVALTVLEQEARVALSPDQAPAQILQGRDALVLTRTRYRRLQRQLRQLQQIFTTTLMILRLVGRGRGFPKRLARNR